MKTLCVLSSLKRFRVSMLGLLALLFLLTLGACGGSPSVDVYDNARVLNVSKVQHAASNLSNPVAIYTTNTFRGTQADFQRVAMQKLNGNPNLIVMAIDTGHRYLYIARGSNVPLSSAGINQAVSTFSTRFNNGDYTNASVAALNSMQGSMRTNSRSRANSGGGLFSGPSLFCCIVPLLIILFLALFAASRRGRMGGTLVRRNPFGQRGSPYGQPGQPVPPDQEPYPGQPNQGRGVNPWAAGGLGAAAGGLAGYELGRRQGEGEPRRDDEFGNETGGGGSFGGENPGGEAGGGGTFGGNAPGGGDFGGNDFGGGGSFGGDAGGGGSFGGDDFDQGGGGGNF